ncbi:ketopantoate reductase family protein [Phytopseudomonas dryadis]|uniref:2-dehydropantoate 2-reductase n=1 Tax=Phytopseudomonas dryadis TaxID=2487520 RepID=A0A4Q9QY97_9GAMM|nr:2-dehydropantoate 2-reductase [Pseudomonas dryadis]TBU90270.1 2-dehydropantoate 2-reductase [Pseudomonas dryadis]
MNIAIIGAGAMGCLFAARLALGGAQVSLVEVDEASIAAIARHGLRLHVGERQHPVIRLPIARAEHTQGPFDLLMVFTKGLHTRSAIASVRHLLGPDTWVLTLQNGLGNAECIAETVAAERVLIGMTDVPADLSAPGVVHAIDSGKVRLWRYRGDSDAAPRAVSQLLRRAGFDSAADPAVQSAIWEKVAFNAALNALCTLLGQPVGVIGASADGRWLAERVVEESQRIAAAEGITFDSARVLARMQRVYGEQAGHRPSMLQDRQAGRPSEIESINGALLRHARRHHLAAPVLETLYRLVRLGE